MGLTRFERDIRAALVGLCANAGTPTWGNPDWTRDVKAAVVRAAKIAGQVIRCLRTALPPWQPPGHTFTAGAHGTRFKEGQRGNESDSGFKKQIMD